MEYCIYCGDTATTRDHVPPKCVSPTSKTTYPACSDCNSAILNGRSIIPLVDRAKYVLKVLKNRRKRIKQANWTKEELGELGPSLRRAIEIMLIETNKLDSRIDHLSNNWF